MTFQGNRDDAQTAEAGSAPAFALVIPMKDEAGTVAALLDECRAAAGPIGPYEICVTDDGSTDGTGGALTAYAAAHPGLRLTVVTHAVAAGQSAAVHDAVRAACAPLVCTLDGDGQNPPDQIPGLLAPLLAGDDRLGLVAGQRVERDDPISKRLASRAANALRAALLHDGTRDTGCGLKAFRRDAFLALPYFDHMHRYLPALFRRDGWEVAHVDVAHRARAAGRSKYTNLGRALVGTADLLGVAWLIRRRKRVRPDQTRVATHGRTVERA